MGVDSEVETMQIGSRASVGELFLNIVAKADRSGLVIVVL